MKQLRYLPLCATIWTITIAWSMRSWAVDARTLIQKTGNAYKSLKSLRLKATLDNELLQPERSPRRGRATTQVTFQEPDKFLIHHDVGDPEETRLFGNASSLIVFHPRLNQFTKNDEASDEPDVSLLRNPLGLSPGLGLLLTLLHSRDPALLLLQDAQRPIFLSPTQRMVGSGKNRNDHAISITYPWDRIEGGLSDRTLRGLKGRTVELRLWIDPKTHLIRQTQIDLAGAIKGFTPERTPSRFLITETFSNIQVNPNIAAGTFQFKAPESARLVTTFKQAQ